MHFSDLQRLRRDRVPSQTNERDGSPPLRLGIDAPRSRLTLRAPVAAGVLAPLNTLAHVAVDTLVEGGERYIEISTTDPRLVVDGYAMLMAVADRIQLDRMDPIAALEQTLATWGSILATRTRMSLQAEVGLFGELLPMQATIRSGAGGAAAWRGGLSEEHDFGFAGLDVEVKTTTSERRLHWIHGIEQLVQTDGAQLWLISIQITRGGDQQGQTLSELAHDVRETTTGAGRDRVQQNLAGAGWHDDDRDLYYERWRLCPASRSSAHQLVEARRAGWPGAQSVRIGSRRRAGRAG